MGWEAQVGREGGGRVSGERVGVGERVRVCGRERVGECV